MDRTTASCFDILETNIIIPAGDLAPPPRPIGNNASAKEVARQLNELRPSGAYTAIQLDTQEYLVYDPAAPRFLVNDTASERAQRRICGPAALVNADDYDQEITAESSDE
jgi:hypothetical protein